MKQRAAVLIGVNKTGQLEPLRAVASGLAAISAWVNAQPGFRTSTGEARIATLSDTEQPVTAQAIRQAVKRFVELGSIEQLFVYFAGHGVNIRFSEYWLLSGAPDDPNEAVNVRGSADLARYCGIPHVILISDACRTAADSIQAQAVEGSLIFPNSGPSTDPGCVDMFYASLVGRPALELRDSSAAAKAFEAIYTTALVRGLKGDAPQLIERADGIAGGCIRPWPLSTYLQQEVPRLLQERGAPLTVSQKPDAIITSKPLEWLSQVDMVTPPAPAPGAPAPQPAPAAPANVLRPSAPADSPARSLFQVAGAAVSAALRSDDRASLAQLRAIARARPRSSAEERLFNEMHERLEATPAPHHFETECGFEIHGTTAQAADSAGAKAEIIDQKKRVRVYCNAPAANVLLAFADGYGTLLPAIRGYIGALTYDESAHELLSVEYEPSNNTPLYKRAEPLLPALRNLRRTVAASAALGSFRFGDEIAAHAYWQQLRDVGAADPALELYASYALHESDRQDMIERLAKAQQERLRMRLFDVAMLARRPSLDPRAMEDNVFPALPLLAQGWTLLAGSNVALPTSIRDSQMRRHLTDSLWTLFDSRGVAVLRDALNQGELR